MNRTDLLEIAFTAAGAVALEPGFVAAPAPVRHFTRAMSPAPACRPSFAPSVNRCVCGRPKGNARLCDGCFRRAPDFIVEQVLNGAPAQRAAAERWLAALAQPVS